MLQVRAITVGYELPSLTFVPGTEQLVRYAAAANDFARIHYDADYAVARGFEGVIVHGLLKAAYLGQVVTNWAGDLGRVRNFRAEYRKVDRPGNLITSRGRVVRVVPEEGKLVVHVKLWTENASGTATTLASAIVDFAVDATN